NHSTSTSAPPTSSSRPKAMPPNHSAVPAIANRMIAEAIRTQRSDFAAVVMPLESPVTAIAAREMVERRFEIDRFEVRPQDVGEIELGIGRLPEQEVREPHFARGTDQEIERRHVGGVEVRLDRLGGDFAVGGGCTCRTDE